MTAEQGLTVAITGATGDIGLPFVRALERESSASEIRLLGRRPFDPVDHELERAKYVQGDVRDPDALAKFVDGADVLVHLAFLIMGGHEETRKVNLLGSRNAFEAAVAAGVSRLVYTSSVAAYGFHADNPRPLTEDVPARGTPEHYYSAQKAELEQVLEEVLSGSDTEAWVFRPVIVAGPESLAFIEALPYVALADRVPPAVIRLLESVPMLKPVLPDPGLPIQLVHSDDVASALVAATLGRGEPGPYNLGADDTVTMTDVADALGWYAVPLPELAVGAAAEVINRLPFLPPEASWINSVRVPMVVDSTRAKERLGWQPAHDSLETLRQTVDAARVSLFPDY